MANPADTSLQLNHSIAPLHSTLLTTVTQKNGLTVL